MKVHIQSRVMGKDDWLLGLLSTQVRLENLYFLGILIPWTIILKEMGRKRSKILNAT